MTSSGEPAILRVGCCIRPRVLMSILQKAVLDLKRNSGICPFRFHVDRIIMISPCLNRFFKCVPKFVLKVSEPRAIMVIINGHLGWLCRYFYLIMRSSSVVIPCDDLELTLVGQAAPVVYTSMTSRLATCQHDDSLPLFDSTLSNHNHLPQSPSTLQSLIPLKVNQIFQDVNSPSQLHCHQ